MNLNRAAAGNLLSDLKDQIISEWANLARNEITSLALAERTKLLNHLPTYLDKLSESLTQPTTPSITISYLKTMGISHALERSLSGSSDLASILKEFQILQNLILKNLEKSDALDFESRQIILDSIQIIIQMAAQTFHDLNKEKVLKREKDFLNAVLENLQDGIVACNEVGELTIFNQASRNFHGLPQGRLTRADLKKAKQVYDLKTNQPLNLDDLPLFRALRGEKINNVGLMIAEPQGNFKYYMTSGQPLYDSEGNLRGAVVAMHDITALKESEKARAALLLEKQGRALAELAQKKISAILEGISDAFVSLSADWKFNYVNTQAEQLLGRPRESLLDKNIWKQFPDWLGSRMELQMRKALYEKNTLAFDEYNAQMKRWFHLKVYGSDKGLTIYFQDITQLRQAAENLREKQEWFQATLQCIGDAVIATKLDANETIIFMNPVAEALTGWKFAEAQNRPLSDIFRIVHGKTHKPIASPVDLVLQKQATVNSQLSLCLISRSEKRYPIEESASPIRNRKGQIDGVVIVFRDITEKSALEDRMDRFAAFVKHSRDFVGMSDLNRQTLFINPIGREIIGINNEQDVTKMTILDFFSPIERARVERVIFPALAKNGYWSGEASIRNFRTGKEIPISWNVFAIFDSETGQALGYGWNSKVLTEQKRAELERSQEREMMEMERNRLSRLFDQAPLPIFMTQGPEHTYVLANPAFVKSVAKGRQVLGRSLNEVWPDIPDKSFLRRMDRVYQTGKTQQALEIPMRLFQEDGNVKQGFFNFVYHPIKNSSGESIGVLVLAMDVTTQVLARQSLRESEERFRVLADSMPQMVWTSNPKGEIDYCSRGWTEFTGISEAELLGWGWLKTLHPDDREMVRESWARSSATKEILSVEHRFQSANGDYHWFLVRGVPLLNDQKEIIKWYGTCTDINEQKHLAEELKMAILQAENANRTKSAFLANMSHEIRTPLSAILGFTELLKSSPVNEIEQKEYLNIISRNGKALTRLIDDILDLSKVEAGRVEIEMVPFSISDLIHEIFDLLREKVRSKGLQLTADISPTVPEHLLSDPTRVRQILINIIGNAVKFTDTGHVHIHVSSTFLSDHKHHIKISVEDTGPGLSEEQQKKLFEPFTQADSSATRKFGGTGLGLALSKRMAKVLEGDVLITRCQLHEGCTFLVTFKAEEIATKDLPQIEKEEKTRESESMAGLSDIRILVVDDLVDNQLLVRRVLSRNGAKVDVASDGQEGIRKALSENYDVVLMDLQMPEMDGYEAVRKLRSYGYQKPILALTAHAMDEEKQRTFEAGYDGHLTKPLNTHELLKTLNKYSKKH